MGSIGVFPALLFGRKTLGHPTSVCRSVLLFPLVYYCNIFPFRTPAKLADGVEPPVQSYQQRRGPLIMERAVRPCAHVPHNIFHR